ncbi:hypothetical protein GGR57DRAFT_518011 [Xylariaceae sp. FL1272]|nr:hypothetical protein GGR57DRAFT_518011 [Xylariaceae sp. FL1272]
MAPPPGYSGPPGARYDSYQPLPPPPPYYDQPPPPPPQSQGWDSRRRDDYYPRDGPNDRSFRGPYSDLREPPRHYSDYRDRRDDHRDDRRNDRARDRDRRGDDYDYRDSQRSSHRDDFRPPQGDFTFRGAAATPSFPSQPKYDPYHSLRPPRAQRALTPRRGSSGHGRGRSRVPSGPRLSFSSRDVSRCDDSTLQTWHRELALLPANQPSNHYDSYTGPRRSDNNQRLRLGRPNRPPTGPRSGGARYQHTNSYKKSQHKASERALLTSQWNTGTEQMLGDNTVRATYRDVDNLTDSDETDMDISDRDELNGPEQPPSKRARTSNDAAATDEAPRWSNPDPYEALPPTVGSRKTGGAKNVMHLIRKARIDAETKKSAAVEAGDEFISCDLSDDDTQQKLEKRTSTNSKLNVQAGNQASTTVDSPARDGRNDDPWQYAPPATYGPPGVSSMSMPSHMSFALPPKPPLSVRQAPSKSVLQPVSKVQPPQPRPPQPQATTTGTTSQQKQAKKSATIDLIPSDSLGSRKRNINDEIKLPHSTLKKVNRNASSGEVMSPWNDLKGITNTCPWIIADHSTTANMGLRLHKELVDFYEYVRPRDFEERVRNDMVDNLRRLIRMKLPESVVLPFGSFMSGLYLPNADMDIAVCSSFFLNGKNAVFDKKSVFWGLKAHLEKHKIAYQGQIEPVARAKVPLLKYTDQHTALRVDISFEKLDGHRAIDTFIKWKQQYPAMPVLVAFVKQFLQMRGLNEPVNGGIGGFSVICMVVHLLQTMPQVQSGAMKPEEHMGEILMEFLDYYGNRFQYETVAISLNPPRLVNKSQATSVVYKNLDRISIIDPNNPANDVSGGSSNFFSVKKRFSSAYRTLRDGMARLARQGPLSPGETLLAPLIGGNYASFEYQRNYLAKIAGKDFPAIDPTVTLGTTSSGSTR